MTALNFPSSPTNGQTYSAAGVTWTYSNTYATWNITSSGPTGYVGSQGYSGSQGIIGYTGSKGTDGVIGYNGSNGYNGSQGYTGSGATGVNWINKSTTYTAVNNDGIIANTSGASFTVKLPASPTTGYYVVFIDGNSSFATNPLTVDGNGGTIATSYTTTTLNITNSKVEFIYNGSTWEIATSTGTRGYSGSVGYTGSLGYTGSQGYTGSASTVIGYTGSKGDIGYTGSIPAAITATSLALGGATLGTNALAVTGTMSLSDLLTAAGGVSSTLTTDATSATTGSIITAGGISTQKALWVGTTSRLVGNTQHDGLVGIGMTPTNVLDITQTQNTVSVVSILNSNAGTSAQARFQATNGTSAGYFGVLGQNYTTAGVYVGGDTYVIAGGNNLNLVSAAAIKFAVNNSATEVARFNSSGQMCINSTSGSGKLSVATTNATAIYAVNGGSSSECMLTNVGGTGVAHVTFLYQGAGPVGSISSPNNTSVAYNTVSDERLKNVLPDQRDFRSIITDLWVGDVEWKAEPGSRQMAMLAQQTNPIYPEAIRVGNTADDMWQADYSKLAPLALWGVKDLYKIIDDLTTRLAALEAK